MPKRSSRKKVAWESPPGGVAKKSQAQDHRALAQELRGRPGEWGHILTYNTSSSSATTANAIRQGSTAAWQPAGHYEAVARTVEGEHRVYARYTGGAGG